MFYKLIVRPLLFMVPPETAHKITFALLKCSRYLPGNSWLNRKIWRVEDPRLNRVVAGIRFPNPVGLAAGLDKDAVAFNELSDYGFGFIEIGTVTPKPQSGNPKPRLFRLPADKALINRMGFNNDGVKKAASRLSSVKKRVIVGGNIGKNKVTPNENATSDYLACFRELYPVVDYFVVNISSPNTPGLRELQEKEPLRQLLQQISVENNSTSSPRPIFVKISPDISPGQADDIVSIVRETGLSGIIISNTTLGRENLVTDSESVRACGDGGLSGKPLFSKSTELLKYISAKKENKFAIIASGGIMSAEDAIEKMAAGADLVQLYTGFIYEGPALVRKINRLLLSIG